jgi:predicted transcriptional regulator
MADKTTNTSNKSPELLLNILLSPITISIMSVLANTSQHILERKKKKEGLSIKEIESEIKTNDSKIIEINLNKLEEEKLIIQGDNGYIITEKGTNLYKKVENVIGYASNAYRIENEL